jgi:hypothetical protein
MKNQLILQGKTLAGIVYRYWAFFRFLCKSTNQHGVHSPFVFGLVTDCFYVKTDRARARRYLVFKRNFKHRGRGELANLMNDKHAFLLLRLLSYLKIENAVYLGSEFLFFHGILDLILPKPKVYEGSVSEDFKLATEGGTPTLYAQFIEENHPHLFFLGRDLSPEEAYLYFKRALRSVVNETIFIFEGIHLNAASEKVWNRIRKHPKVTVSVDVFFAGMVFFRKEQVKEHFTIRI